MESLKTLEVSRRTVVKGAAWSLPVIAAAVATPMATASTVPEQNFDLLRFKDGAVTVDPPKKTGLIRGSLAAYVAADASLPTAFVIMSIDVAGLNQIDGPYTVKSGAGQTPTWNFVFEGVPAGTYELVATISADNFVTKTSFAQVTVL